MDQVSDLENVNVEIWRWLDHFHSQNIFKLESGHNRLPHNIKLQVQFSQRQKIGKNYELYFWTVRRVVFQMSSTSFLDGLLL